MSASRDERVEDLLRRAFVKAAEGSFTPMPAIEADLDAVFGTSAWGFREILLVIGVAMLENSGYRASRAFYDCNPRALFEGPIRSMLMEQGVPHRKSGPLNVAKATLAINEEWAAQRRPSTAAQATVRIVIRLEEMSRRKLENFLLVLLARLLKEANQVRRLVVEARPESDPVNLYRLAKALIDREPDAGNTPQRIVGLMMVAYHQVHGTGVRVEGYEDRASVTTTTSKKAGDIAEVSENAPLVVYEVTVKPFGKNRVSESYSAIRDYDEANGTTTAEIIVLCRQQDVHPEAQHGLGVHLGVVEYQDLTFRFVDIYGWMLSQLLRMSPKARLEFYRLLNEYMSNPNTSVRVKTLWRELNEAR
jgi:hypothetical protein